MLRLTEDSTFPTTLELLYQVSDDYSCVSFSFYVTRICLICLSVVVIFEPKVWSLLLRIDLMSTAEMTLHYRRLVKLAPREGVRHIFIATIIHFCHVYLVLKCILKHSLPVTPQPIALFLMSAQEFF